MSQWWLLVCASLLLPPILLTPIVFCFWCIYLIDAIHRKRKFYRNLLKRIHQDDDDDPQQIEAYNAKTEVVKMEFLFCMNLIDWLAIILTCIAHILNLIQEFYEVETHQSQAKNSTDHTLYALFFVPRGNLHLNLTLAFRFITLSNDCFVLGLVLFASLCIYLAARMARKSWISSKYIPHLIVVFIFLVILHQILASFCSITVISNWFKTIIITVSFIIAFKQYRKLLMVINWTIVDLSVSQNKDLLTKQIKMKKTFKKLSNVLWIGILLIVIAEYIDAILFTLIIVLREKTDSNIYISLCENSYVYNTDVALILTIFSWICSIVAVTGVSLILIPYYGYGLSTMFVTLYRLYKGKTGYKTQFNSQLNDPLI